MDHDPSDPPTQEKLYELTHEADRDLYAHPRDCNCPACDGSGDEYQLPICTECGQTIPELEIYYTGADGNDYCQHCFDYDKHGAADE